MPVALDVDWSSVRTLAVAVGVREAARRLGLSEEAVMKRCSREGWLAEPEMRAAAARSVQERSSALSACVRSPAQELAKELLALGSKSRIGFARGLAKAASHVETLEGPEMLEKAQEVKATIQSAALVHGWSANAPVTRISLHVSGHDTGLPDAGTTVEAEWVEVPQPMDDDAFN